MGIKCGGSKMNDKELIKEAKQWIKDYETTQPDNVMVDYDTFEGSAYSIISRFIRR